MSNIVQSDCLVNMGNYVVLQRKNYMKLHKITSNKKAMLGKDVIYINEIIGKPFWTTYKMESVKKGEFSLSECTDLEGISEEFIKNSGEDNRNIYDDGSSQMLSKTEIIDLRESGLSSGEMLGHLIENSKTFMNKTEFSQEKYLKKKEKKYFDYITIRQPTIRLIMNILHSLDPSKLLGLRIDSLSQLITAINMHSDGMYILYESGCQGIIASSMLNCISSGGNLIHLHPEYTPNKTAISAMNFSDEQLERLFSINIHSLLRKLWQEDQQEACADIEKKEEGFMSCSIESVTSSTKEEMESENNTAEKGCEDGFEVQTSAEITENKQFSEQLKTNKKRKLPNENEIEEFEKRRKVSEKGETAPKRPQWKIRTEKAAGLLQSKKADGLVIVAKERPTNIIDTLLPYLGLSKSFVVYSPYREVLQELYVHLKSKHKIADLWLTESWFRAHQVLPDRTHPDVLMSGSGGYCLTGILVDG